MFRKQIVFGLALFAVAFHAMADGQSKPWPTKGVFAFVQSPHFGAGAVAPLKAPDAEKILAVVERPYIAGLTYYIAWADLEPRPGEYRWALLDEVLKAVAARGKVLNLGIFSRDAPAWLQRRPGLRRFTQSFRRHGSGQAISRETVFPLDAAYRDAYFSMVEALAAHKVGGDGPALRDHPALGYVAVGGPSNGSGLETFIQVVPEQSGQIKAWIREATGAEDWEVGLAQAWMDAFHRYKTAFGGQNMAVALSFGLETGNPSSRTARVAELLYGQLETLRPMPAVMTLNLTGAEWWYPSSRGRNAPRRILGLLERSADSGWPVGLQMIGISAASRTAEARARPFDQAMSNAAKLGVDWIEIWVEDLLIDRGAIPARRPWVDSTHPDFRGIETAVKAFVPAMNN